MTTQYKIQKDVAGYNGFGLSFSDQIYSATLTASTDTTLTVPSNAAMGVPLNTINKWIAVIQLSIINSVWFALNETAEIPAGNTFAQTTSDLIVGSQFYGVEVKTGDIMHFITPNDAVDIMVKFYALPAC